jgi:hypothetical protein
MTVRASGGMHESSTKSAWASGTSIFAAVLLTTLAVFQILEGISAIASDHVYVHGVDYTYRFDVTAWGWIHLIIGLVALGTGIGILMSQVWAYILGIVVACVSALANFASIPHYPIWSIVVIAFDVLVIWALATLTVETPSGVDAETL